MLSQSSICHLDNPAVTSILSLFCYPLSTSGRIASVLKTPHNQLDDLQAVFVPGETSAQPRFLGQTQLQLTMQQKCHEIEHLCDGSAEVVVYDSADRVEGNAVYDSVWFLRRSAAYG
ncbi:unnamed protein product [Soboliphyme baturini]|uniref:GGACT domain-containing protein n=1 Tax=Soboliphyme baturini TaxID=241478 RepID=A0A183ISZ2_9BILA|nr:unnamed protein product [Soboliphyme baturini]